MNALVARLLASMSVCAAAGAIDGILTGFIFGLVRDEFSGQPRPVGKLLLGALILAGVGWLVILFVIGILYRYGVWAIALQSLITALITSIATVFVVNAHLQAVGALIGLLIGLIVGSLLCLLCERLFRRTAAGR